MSIDNTAEQIGNRVNDAVKKGGYQMRNTTELISNITKVTGN